MESRELARNLSRREHQRGSLAPYRLIRCFRQPDPALVQGDSITDVTSVSDRNAIHNNVICDVVPVTCRALSREVASSSLVVLAIL